MIKKLKNSKMIFWFLLIVFLFATFFALLSYKKFYKSNVHKINIPIIVGFAQLGSESAWRNANTLSVRDAAKKAGIVLIYKNAEGSQAAQKAIIRDFIFQKVDIIIFPPLVAEGWEDVLKEAKNANIPVIIADRTIVPNDTTLYSAFVGGNFTQEGKKVARWLISNTDPNKNIKVLELRGLSGSSPAEQRAKGFRSVIAEHSNISFIDSVSGDFIKAKGKLDMQKMLKKHGKNIDVVFAHNDDMALGAIEAIEEYGLNPGKDILILSVDGEKEALLAIKNGKLNVSAECTPLLGPTLMNSAKKLYNGEKVQKRILMEEKVFTINNVDKELPMRTY